MTPRFLLRVRGIGAAILAAAMLLQSTSAGAREWVAFPAASTTPELESTSSTPSGLELRGQLIRPAGDGRFPAVVMLHDCRGIRPYQVGWADKLAGWGYVVLIVDSFMTRYDADVCAHLPVYAAEGRANDRVGDALGALEFLSTQPFVDPDRILIMGWAYDAVLRAVAEPEAAEAGSKIFKAAIAISPSCRSVFGKSLTAPALLLIGGNDDWTLASDCERLSIQAGNEGHIELVVYPNARHGFDDPDLDEPLRLDDAWNPNRSGQRGVDLVYDEDARADAVQQVRDFLNRHVPTSWDPAYAISPASAGDARAEWAIDPHQPGPNLPPVGRSTFDQLFSVVRDGEAVYELPFPFEALTAQLRADFSPEQSGISPIKQALIPLGRSLQRHAAAPDFFQFPRVVVAVDGEAAGTRSNELILLKDRLFLGYQERSQTIEVISYNELAGRFEFQLVKNYGSGDVPEVRYANRAICISCHQNAGPIFALFPWDETNRNAGVAARLARVKPRFYGVPAFQGAGPAASIDASTDRASLLPVHQRLWTEACGDEDADRAARCRAGAFIAMLQYRLSGAVQFDRGSASYRDEFFKVSIRQWQRRWPYGLKVPNPDLRNREPVFAHPDIPAIFDPLNLRPPLEVWSAERNRDIEKVITGLSETIPATDLKRLDQFLDDARAQQDIASSMIESTCSVTEQTLAGGVVRVLAKCSLDGDVAGLQGSVRFRDGVLIDGSLDQLSLPGGATLFQLLVRAGGRVVEGDTVSVSLVPAQPQTGFKPRLASGSTITGITLRYVHELRAVGEPVLGRMRVFISDDFRVVTDAVERLRLDEIEARSGVFSNQPFQGTRAMQALFRTLGWKPTSWCCDSERAFPPARAEGGVAQENVAGLSEVQDSASVRMLYRYCASCHRTDNPVPPNFLSGDAATVERRLGQCAPRIFYRLSMWAMDAEQRAVTPMPPMAALASHGIDNVRWRDSPELKSLRDYAGRLYESESSGKRATELLRRDYAKLRICTGG